MHLVEGDGTLKKKANGTIDEEWSATDASFSSKSNEYAAGAAAGKVLFSR